MVTAFWLCAVIGGTVIVCQFFLTLLGMGGDHDAGDGHDFSGGGHEGVGIGGHDQFGHDQASPEGGHEVGHGQEPSWFFTYLTLRTLTAAVAFFGLAGLGARYQGLEEWQAFIIAIAAGGAAMVLVAKLMGLLTRLNVDGTVRVEQAVGSRGTVYLSVPGKRAGVGKVHVSQANRLVEYQAITKEESLPTGTKVVVVGVIAPDTVEVAQATEAERIHV